MRYRCPGDISLHCLICLVRVIAGPAYTHVSPVDSVLTCCVAPGWTSSTCKASRQPDGITPWGLQSPKLPLQRRVGHPATVARQVMCSRSKSERRQPAIASTVAPTLAWTLVRRQGCNARRASPRVYSCTVLRLRLGGVEAGIRETAAPDYPSDWTHRETARFGTNAPYLRCESCDAGPSAGTRC